jgi:D-3-phosphoglycerate dehydrogenase
MHKIFLTEPIHDSGVNILREAGLNVLVSPSTDADTLIKFVKSDVYGIIVRTSPLEGRVLKAGKNIKIISRTGIGYNNIDLRTAEELNILITNVPDANVYSVTEYIFTALLILSRKLVLGDRALREGKLSSPNASLPGMVRKCNLGGNELPGKTLGIIGLGKIGRNVAELANDFLKMKILAFDPYVSEAPSFLELVQDVEDIYRKADYVTLHTPLSKDTENMIGTKQLALMKPTAFLINAARGELVVDQDLADAVNQGIIAGAAVDVYRKEPPCLDNPLFSAANVLLTPHVAGSTDEALERMSVGAAKAMADFCTGKKPANIVNPEVWNRLHQ